MKYRKQDVVVMQFCHFPCRLQRALVQPRNSSEEFVHISDPDLVPVRFQKHYDSITEASECHLVSFDKHMPYH